MSHWKQIGSENARARSKIYSLMAPFKWQYLCGMVLRMFSQVSWGFWYGSIVALPGEIMENSTNPLEEVRVPRAPQINIPAWVFCMRWCADLEFRGRRPRGNAFCSSCGFYLTGATPTMAPGTQSQLHQPQWRCAWASLGARDLVGWGVSNRPYYSAPRTPPQAAG